MAPVSEASSQGWATAVATAGMVFAFGISRSYFSCVRSETGADFLLIQASIAFL
jgi:hypothetical protein